MIDLGVRGYHATGDADGKLLNRAEDGFFASREADTIHSVPRAIAGNLSPALSIAPWPVGVEALEMSLFSEWGRRVGKGVDHELIAQADYRVHVWKRFGAVVFGAAGNVFGSNGASLGDEMKYTYGGGLRFNINKHDALNLRVDYTFTSFGGQGLSLGVGEAF